MFSVQGAIKVEPDESEKSLLEPLRPSDVISPSEKPKEEVVSNGVVPEISVECAPEADQLSVPSVEDKTKSSR